MGLRLLAFLLLGLFVHAAEPQKKIFPYPYQQHDLANGLRLITVPTDFPNVVALYIVVQTGSRNEVEPGKSGFAHLFEHMMFRGTRTFPPEKYEAVLKQIGAASNAFTSDDLTAYHTTFSKEDLETVLRMESDRFKNLEYSPDVFRTETLAVLGEYNKNSASPTQKIHEVLRDTAFDKHTYKHTTMGFLKDIQDMPNQYEYSRQFFDRYYRPEYATIIIAGDITHERAKALVEKHWGDWKRGSFKAEILAEPPQQGPRQQHIEWTSPTLPWVTVAFKMPAYTDTSKDSAALDIISFLAFSQTSDLYQKLVIQEQRVDGLFPSVPDHVDPYVFTVMARVKKESDMESVKQQILETFSRYKDSLVPGQRLDAVKKHLRYSFALGLSDSQDIAESLAHYVALRRTPETMNRVYALYDQITAEDIREVARKYFNENSRTIVTLTGAKPK
jgi:zinc protease